MIVLLNGSFGVGKTTVARQLARRLPRSAVFDPEKIGFVLQRLPRWIPLPGGGRGTGDFQDNPPVARADRARGSARPGRGPLRIYRRAGECVAAHGDPIFGEGVETDGLTPDAVAERIWRRVS